jgi:hypothetical protein
MTQTQVEHQIARTTGESLATICRMGFSAMSQQPDELEPEDVQLVLDCPFCGSPVPYPGLAGDGSEAMAECVCCDVYFEFDPEEVYAVPADEPSDRAAERAS